MPETLYEMLSKISSILHWLGKYNESMEIAQLAEVLSSKDLKTAKEVVRVLLHHNELELILDAAAQEDVEGCYKIVDEYANNVD